MQLGTRVAGLGNRPGAWGRGRGAITSRAQGQRPPRPLPDPLQRAGGAGRTLRPLLAPRGWRAARCCVASAAGGVHVRFVVQRKVKFGESIKLVGSLPVLGDWKVRSQRDCEGETGGEKVRVHAALARRLAYDAARPLAPAVRAARPSAHAGLG